MRILEETIENETKKYMDESECFYIESRLLREFGLDNRCGPIYASIKEEFIASQCKSSIEYYGGFEYIDSDFKLVTPNFVFYDANSYDETRAARVLEEIKSALSSGHARIDSNKNLVLTELQDKADVL